MRTAEPQYMAQYRHPDGTIEERLAYCGELEACKREAEAYVNIHSNVGVGEVVDHQDRLVWCTGARS